MDLEIFTKITHRSNIPQSWKHISREVVEESVLRNRLYRALDKARNVEKPLDIQDYQELLEEADREISTKEIAIQALQQDLEDRTAEVYRLASQFEGGRRSVPARSTEIVDEVSPTTRLMRDAMVALQADNLSLEQALTLTGCLYPERIVVLDSAISSAREADGGHFMHAKKAYELLTRLACDYWDLMADGGTTQQAKSVFTAANYSATENWLSPEGKRLRTFIYKGQPIRMDMHLRYGVKDSKVTTLRIHYEWVPEDRKLVIGHCGKHLDF
jgi:hypothetical protein